MKALAALTIGATSLMVTTSLVSAGSEQESVVITVAVKLADGASIADVAAAPPTGMLRVKTRSPSM